MKKTIINHEMLSLIRYRLTIQVCPRPDLFPIKKIIIVYCLISLLSVVKTNAQEIIADYLNKGSNSSGYSVLHYSEVFQADNLVILGDKLYGTELWGGIYGDGRLFSINTDGSDYKSLYDFTSAEYDPASLAVHDSVLYGTTRYNGGGILFKYDLRINGPWTKLAKLNCSFSFPQHSIVISDGVIYGTVFASLSGEGRIFRINIDGTGYKALLETNNFTYKLVWHEGYLYCLSWGNWNFTSPPPSTLYRIKTDGTDYKLLHTFTGGVDGSVVRCNLVLVGGKIYSMTERGGAYDAGIFYRINPDGTGFEVIADIPDIGGQTWPSNYIRKIAYSEPYIYATQGGDLDENCLLLRVNEEDFEILWEFESSLGGYDPDDFVIDDGIIYGSTSKGGWYDYGVIYKYVIGDLGIPDNRLKLSVKRPVQIKLNTKDNLEAEKNESIDLDTTFSVIGNIQYTHSWKVKTDNGYIGISKDAKIISDTTFYLLVTTIQGCAYSDSVKITVKNTTDIPDTDIDDQIRIYPNPNTGDFRIMIDGGSGRYSYEIIDVTGTKTADGIIDCTTEQCIFDVSLGDAKPGTYILAIEKNGIFLGQKRFIILR